VNGDRTPAADGADVEALAADLGALADIVAAHGALLDWLVRHVQEGGE
jgi:hypothetical protein